MTLKGKKKKCGHHYTHTPDKTKTDYVEMDTRRIHFLVSFFFPQKHRCYTVQKNFESGMST